MEKQVFKLRESVDVYKIGEDTLYFYFINKREGINIVTSSSTIEFISKLDGVKTIENILLEMKMDYDNDLKELLKFLLNKGIIYNISNNEEKVLSLEEERLYSRQLVFFQEYFEQDAYKLQKKLYEEKFLIFGIGSIGSGIAIELAMMGVQNFILVDKGIINESSIGRHYYFREKNIGKSKVESLKEYILDLNPNANIEIFKDKINYDTDLEKYFSLAPTFIVNTLDEPYIGITSLKIGRETYKKKIPLFVAGGFDAHLMSTGELIISDKTPCVDCYTSYFTETLKDWKPKYNKKAIENDRKNIFEVGGLASMSLFSISYGVMEIIKYLADNDYVGRGRGELLFEDIKIAYLVL